MTPGMVTLAFDLGLAVLLIVTIGYCGGLSKRIRAMQDTKGELAGIIAQFDQATGRALTTMGELQTTAKRITDALQVKIDKANFLADDLAFLIEKSTKLTTQLEQQMKSLSETVKPAAPPERPAAHKPKPASWLMPSKTEPPAPAPSASSLEALLSRLAGAPPSAAPEPQRKTEQSQFPRTGAERELFEALKGR